MSDDKDPAESQRFPTADYVLQLPLELDKYGMPTAASYKSRIIVSVCERIQERTHGMFGRS